MKRRTLATALLLLTLSIFAGMNCVFGTPITEGDTFFSEDNGPLPGDDTPPPSPCGPGSGGGQGPGGPN